MTKLRLLATVWH